ncbi:MAG: FHA domain-containing protein [Chthoniobacteraceae bacterium]
MQFVVLRGLPEASIEITSDEGVIGRSPEATLELRHPEVSRRHCRFRREGACLVIEDLESSRGTHVNGARLTEPATLNAGEEFAVGPITLRFVLDSAPAEKAAPPVAPVAEKPDRAGALLVNGIPADRIEISGELTIGRDAGCEVQIQDGSVSRRHALLRALPEGGFSVTDLQSAGGSFINGHRFDEHKFTVGDRLQIGPIFFQFDGLALVSVVNSSGGSLRARAVVMRVSERSLLEKLSGRPGQANTILDHISIVIPASRFFGLIGPSGAGKSSLLNSLAGLRKPEGGTVLVDGRDVYASGEPPAFGFVPQDDIVHPELTVRQALSFAARLRLSARTPANEIERLIAQTMDQLGLVERADLPIWRLSGGQRKRVSVAVELLAKPSILFLDEPTSGLDPATEFQLMSLLRDLADTGCTIVCTTHVMENAYLIDQLVILVAGCLAFQGSASEVRDYFRVPKLTALYDELGKRPAKEWQGAFAERQAAAESEPLAEPAAPVPAATRPRRAFSLPILLARQWKILKADWWNLLILLGQPVVIAALVCWATETRELVMFFAYLATLWFGCSNAAQEIVREIAIYRRERLVGVGAHSYLASKFLYLIAITLAQAGLLYVSILWFEGGRDGSVLLQLAALAGSATAAVGIGCTISAFANNVMQAVTVVPLVLIPMIIFSGYVITSSGMEKPVRRVSEFTPGFMAQEVMDTSFVYDRELIGDVLENHNQALRNLDGNDPDHRNEEDRFVNLSQARTGMGGLALWTVVTYWLAWFGLRRQERQ